MPLDRLDSATLADRAYDSIREAIVTGELAPNEKVTERGLADRLAVSPTPIREALRRLEQDRLVERTGPRTLRVTDFTDQTASEAVLAEGALRVVAARLAATNATEGQLQQMERTLAEGNAELARLTSLERELTAADLAPLLAIHRRFHTELNEGCNNPVILRLLSMVDAFKVVSVRLHVSNELDADVLGSGENRFRDHWAIFEAVRDRDADLAEKRMTEHGRRGEHVLA